MALSTKKTAKRSRPARGERAPGRGRGTAASTEPAVSYDGKMKRLETILTRLDNSETSIDELAQDVREGVGLIKELTGKLNEVETEVRDAFEDLEASVPKADAEGAEDDEDE